MRPNWPLRSPTPRFESDCRREVHLSERCSLVVNGSRVEVTAERDTPLLYVLRNQLGLKGARFGCGEGACGSCTVLMDGHPVFSCDTPVWSVQDRRIETIEGLAKNGDLHPLQRAVLAEQAGQCGYCLSGIVMRAKALLAQTPRPSRSQIAAALHRNLCRCGAHNRIIRAIQRAGAEIEGGER
jgi:nicotinate dehydrogenase subunit A